MMPLGLVPEFRTQSLGWRFQEAHRYLGQPGCGSGNFVSTYVTMRARFGHNYTALAQNLLSSFEMLEVSLPIISRQRADWRCLR